VTSESATRWFVALSPEGAARAVGEEIIKALSRQTGPDRLKVFDCRTYLKAFSGLLVNADEAMTVDLLNHALIVQCLDFRTTHLLVLPLSPVTLFSLKLLRNQHVITVHWFYEDFRAAKYWKEVAAGYDFFFGIQKGLLVDHCAACGARYAFLPTAAGAGCAPAAPAGGPPAADVAFIGIPSSYRVRVLELLASAGISLAIAGSGWNKYRGGLERYIVTSDWTGAGESASIVSKAIIGLNLSVRDPEGDRENTHISPRAFDVLQAGRSLVTEEVPLIKEVIPDCWYHTFSSPEQAIEVVKSVLSNPAAEAANAKKNRETVTTRHTYEVRVRKIIELINVKKPQAV
jgi:spore maturation protein CgeB